MLITITFQEILNTLDAENLLNPVGAKTLEKPWCPKKNTSLPETLIFLNEIVPMSKTLPWEAADRKLFQIWSANENKALKDLISTAQGYFDYLSETRHKLYVMAQDIFETKPEAKKDLFSNTKYWIRLRFRMPMTTTKILLKDLHSSDSITKEHVSKVNDVIKCSDTILFFAEFCNDKPLIEF